MLADPRDPSGVESLPPHPEPPTPALRAVAAGPGTTAVAGPGEPVRAAAGRSRVRAVERRRGRGPWIGLILVESGRMSAADVQRVVQAQPGSALRFGETACRLGLVTAADVEYALARQFVFPYVTGDTAGLAPALVAAHAPRDPVAEGLRGLRARILAQAVTGGRRRACVAVVSRDRGDGRSFTAANLAVVFAQSGRRTLLVDGDLRRPSLHALFGLDNRVGLSTLLAGRSGAEAVQRVAALPRLYVLTGGPTPPNPLELLEHPRLGQARRRADARFDVTIIDTPAEVDGSDARTLAAAAGAAILVGTTGRTRVAQAQAIVRDLEQSDVRVLGLVYNHPG